MNDVLAFFDSVWLASPPLVHGVLIFMAGWFSAWLVGSLVHGVLSLLRFDHLADRVGLGEFLRNGHVTMRPARLFGALVYQVLLLGSILWASRALDIAAVSAITDSLVQALPSITAAIFITVIGLVLVGFLCNLVETIARNTSVTNIRAVVSTFRYTGLAITLLLASDQLGFGKSLLSTLLLIAFGAVCFGVALAYGLGSVDLARRSMEVVLKNLEKRGDPPPPSESSK